MRGDTVSSKQALIDSITIWRGVHGMLDDNIGLTGHISSLKRMVILDEDMNSSFMNNCPLCEYALNYGHRDPDTNDLDNTADMCIEFCPVDQHAWGGDRRQSRHMPCTRYGSIFQKLESQDETVDINSLPLVYKMIKLLEATLKNMEVHETD